MEKKRSCNLFSNAYLKNIKTHMYISRNPPPHYRDKMLTQFESLIFFFSFRKSVESDFLMRKRGYKFNFKGLKTLRMTKKLIF